MPDLCKTPRCGVTPYWGILPDDPHERKKWGWRVDVTTGTYWPPEYCEDCARARFRAKVEDQLDEVHMRKQP